MKGLSVIIPTYNRAPMLRDSLVSLRSRSHYEPMEVVVVDGGSEEETTREYAEMKQVGLFDKLVLLPHHNNIPRNQLVNCISRALKAGFDASRFDYPYLLFGADDLLYRTGWEKALIDMIDSEWAKRNGVKVVSGFNHWSLPDDFDTMTGCVKELYKSEDGKVEGYCAVWGGNWFMRKADFVEMGGFENNLKTKQLPEGFENNYEMIFQYRFTENGWNWGTTRETYVQTMATPGSSSLGNYREDDKGEKITNEQFHNGIAVGVAWKDE